ncbi:MAG: phosphatase PAP2 family protein [Gemmatimonadales bacterium]|nr:phosphatase PAP2 family protein [Gemmatimonadales bacterium]
MIGVRLVDRLDARDREWLLHLSLSAGAGAWRRRAWVAITHTGGTIAMIGSVVVPLLLEPWPRAISWRAGFALLVSHIIIQAVKRIVHRERPPVAAVIACPDRFSFPSGHATSSLAVALSYGFAFPSLAGPLVGFGMLIGWSRVVLGVHYPGDVLVGQLIAVATVLGLSGMI